MPTDDDARVDAAFLGDFVPDVVYCEYDGPRVFTVRHAGRTFYAHHADECWPYPPDGTGWSSYHVREVTPADLDAVENNRVDLRAFVLAGDPLYRVVVRNAGLEAWRTTAAAVADNLPKAGVFLRGPT